jgi:succinate dehydrogenase / fumarate reductase flavoprotein subunit
LIVFGKRAGEYAAQFAKKNSVAKLDEQQIQAAARQALEPLERQTSGGGGENAYQIQYDLQDTMQAYAGIVRTEQDLSKAKVMVQALKQRAAKSAVPGNREYNPGWHTALDLQNLLTVSEALILSGLDRKESRGGHFREDFPSKDEANFGKHNTIIRRANSGGGNGEMQLVRQPIKPMPDELKRVVEENK